MSERRVVPLRLIPTIKTGESVENSVVLAFAGFTSGSVTKKSPSAYRATSSLDGAFAME